MQISNLPVYNQAGHDSRRRSRYSDESQYSLQLISHTPLETRESPVRLSKPVIGPWTPLLNSAQTAVLGKQVQRVSEWSSAESRNCCVRTRLKYKRLLYSPVLH